MHSSPLPLLPDWAGAGDASGVALAAAADGSEPAAGVTVTAGVVVPALADWDPAGAAEDGAGDAEDGCEVVTWDTNTGIAAEGTRDAAGAGVNGTVRIRRARAGRCGNFAAFPAGADEAAGRGAAATPQPMTAAAAQATASPMTALALTVVLVTFIVLVPFLLAAGF